ncbi:MULTISPECIES: hypothetical protein [Clostridium]|jgi:hypothetical protein|uniref:hypothetical protein n=1 Tax=Clostridium TaxID=1485 RepID=UPI000288A023|nr:MULTISPECIES: hypothetical protein [Clostridium]MDF2504756.1 hypothetical protein [Clostridium sp.]
MNLEFKIRGLDSIKNRLIQLEKNDSVSYNNLFTTSFMKKHTKFSSFNEFLKSGNFIVNSINDFKAIPDREMDSYVRRISNFSSWQNMLDSAVKDYTAKKLGF